MAKVVCMSMWMNDADRNLDDRMTHLLSKSGIDRYIWVIGDSSDGTELRLREAAAMFPDIEIIRNDTGMEATDPDTRLRKLSLTVNAGLAAIREDDTHLLLHESDLISPHDVAERFVAADVDAIAGWVSLGENGIFYDTYAYRAHGVKFNNEPPYHVVYRPDELFEVESFGSCWMVRTELIRGMQCERGGVIDICAEIRKRGGRLWVDPRIPIVQPVALWRSQNHASV